MLTVENLIVFLSIVGSCIAIGGAFFIRKKKTSMLKTRSDSPEMSEYSLPSPEYFELEKTLKRAYSGLTHILTGLDPAVFAKYDGWSKRKNSAYAAAILLSTSISFIIGFLFSTRVLGVEIIYGIMIGIAFGICVFVIERTIIMPSNSSIILASRITVGCIFAIMGSFAVHNVIYKDEPVNKSAHRPIVSTETALDSIKISFLTIDRSSTKIAFDTGKIAHIKIKNAIKLAKHLPIDYSLVIELTKLDSLNSIQLNDWNLEIKKKDSILARLSAEVSRLEKSPMLLANDYMEGVFKGTTSVLFFLLFFVLFTFLELLVPVLKYGVAKSKLERDEQQATVTITKAGSRSA